MEISRFDPMEINSFDLQSGIPYDPFTPRGSTFKINGGRKYGPVMM